MAREARGAEPVNRNNCAGHASKALLSAGVGIVSGAVAQTLRAACEALANGSATACATAVLWFEGLCLTIQDAAWHANVTCT